MHFEAKELPKIESFLYGGLRELIKHKTTRLRFNAIK
jgi:hypothetical protein